VVALLSGEACACGGFAIVEPGLGELHRIFVARHVRRLGLGRAMLEELERLARVMHCERMRLETGLRQPEALMLYRAANYVRIPAFGSFADDPLSVCFEKMLT